ncbi:unnamed protein product [Lupinus luteus]|uniref:cytidine deaminase n=1 Tax=Lupinus luteus TaxID=3873 RepID=A0AAV1YGZ6_LUPLU
MDQKPRFVISASEAESMAQSIGTTLPHLLPSLVKPSQSLARPPISNFPVAAVGLGVSGRIFIGVNLEFPGLPLHHTVHAEQFLITNLSLNAEPLLLSFAVSAAPCGHCRQFLQELPSAPDIKILITSHNTPLFTPLSHFLSHHFGPHDLLPKGAPLLLDPRHNNLSLLPHQNFDFLPNGVNGPSTNPDPKLKLESFESPTSIAVNGYATNSNDELKLEALEAANKSHAPYSGSPSGVALLDCEGKIYKGSYLESAAYNPSLGPVQAALVAFVAGGGGGGGGGYDQIVEAVLVEKDGAVIKQEQTARLLLNSISPNCHFTTFLCTSGAD